MSRTITLALRLMSGCIACLSLILLWPNHVVASEYKSNISVLNTSITLLNITPTPIPSKKTIHAAISTNITPTLSLTATEPLPTFTPTPEIVSVTSTSSVFLPAILLQLSISEGPPNKVLFCSTLSSPRTIPDNDLNGIEDSLSINDTRQIVDLDISLDISHSWVGDLIAYLRHVGSDNEITLLRRPGRTGTDLGCGYNDIKTILDDEISSLVDEKCAPAPAAISGIYKPNQSLSAFNGENIAGTWTLKVIDRHPRDTGRLNRWCLFASISDNPAPPTPTPTPPPSLPQASVNGVTGKDQSLPLDCESRSAVDWAAFFGYRIDELEFFNRLPHSDNPDKGFVGNVYGEWGQIPPNPYGVHAEPVANLLREYGLSAYARRPLQWEQLKAEISAGIPVIVWVIDSITNGIPIYYTPSDGLTTIVARYEHTVIVIGYSNSNVYYLNGDTTYTTSITQFLDSWSALGNMAITASP